MRDELTFRAVTRRLLAVAALLAISCGLAPSRADAQQPAPPKFSVELTPVDSAKLPALQSFSWAQSGNRWLIIGGRTQGLHLFVQSSDGGSTPPPNAFPPALANTSAWVIEPGSGKAWSSPLSKLPATCKGGGQTPPPYNCADALSSTNQQYFQDGNVLYVVGGYGIDNKTGQMTTFGTVSAIKVNETINAIVSGAPIDDYVQQTSTFFNCQLSAGVTPPYSPSQQQLAKMSQCIRQVQGGSTQGIRSQAGGFYAKVTGGDLEKIGNVFYLVFGQTFEGLYSTLEGDYGKWPVTQVYTNRITTLNLTPDPLAVTVLSVIQDDPNNLQSQYHRRDLNVLPTLDRNGRERITVHGGVFVPGRNSAYRQPIFIDNVTDDPLKTKVTVNNYQQVMSQYDCATLKMFDRKSSNMMTVFFGGISLYYLDQKLNQIKIDDGLPFIDDVTVMTGYPDGTFSEFVRAEPLDGYIGTDAKFIPDPSVAAAGNGVIYFDALKGKAAVGYFYGGIRADRSQAGDATGKFSRASNALYRVVVTPAAQKPNYWVPANPNDPSQIPRSDKGGVNTRPRPR